MKVKTNRGELKYYVLLVVLALFVCIGMNSFSNRLIYTDSSVFQYIALEMQHGRMPYLDSFDHKGPLIYVINFLGLTISRSFGVWLFECAAIVVSLLYFYRIARLCAEPSISLIAVGLSSVFLSYCLEKGNLTEEYALPFISVSLYIFLQYFTMGKVRNRSVFLCGICLGGVLLLRPNMIAVWIAGCLLVLFDCIRNKTYSQLPGFIGSFLAGIAVCVFPFGLWLYAKGALRAAMDSYIAFNFSYSGTQLEQMGLLEVSDNLLFHYIPVLSAMGMLVMLFWDRANKSVMILLAWILSAILIVQPRNAFQHYVVVLLPVIVYPIAWLISWCVDSNGEKRNAVILVFAAILLIPAAPQAKRAIGSALYSVSHAIAAEPGTDAVVDIILERTDDDDCITVYGNKNQYYLFSQRLSASRYSYQSPISSVDPHILEEYFEDLRENTPKVIVWPGCSENPDWKNDRMYRFIQEYGYLQDTNEACVFYLP